MPKTKGIINISLITKKVNTSCLSITPLETIKTFNLRKSKLNNLQTIYNFSEGPSVKENCKIRHHPQTTLKQRLTTALLLRAL